MDAVSMQSKRSQLDAWPTPDQPGSTNMRISENPDDLEITDPKLRTQKMLLDAMYGDENNARIEKKRASPDDRQPTADPAQPPVDSVTLSSRSLELYQSSTLSLAMQNSEGARLEIQVERTTAVRLQAQTQQGQVAQADPLVLDLDGDGIELTDVTRGAGVRFDLTNTGSMTLNSWVAPDDGFLALDRNGNGTIDNGGELFGDQHGRADGFAELASFDSDGNGIIDRNDPVFSLLQVWQDRNQNGISESDELNDIEHVGIDHIKLNYKSVSEKIAGNTITGYSSYGGSAPGLVAEAFLNYYV